MMTIDKKLLSKDVLLGYGFSENKHKSNASIEVMTREQVDIVIKDGHFYYTNLGIDYPIKDLDALLKFYKEVKNHELKPL